MDKTLGNKTTEKLKRTRKRRHHEARKEMPIPKEQTDSIITKHRITNCQDIEQQMMKDLSKVLDISSFRINNLGTSAESQNHKNLSSSKRIL